MSYRLKFWECYVVISGVCIFLLKIYVIFPRNFETCLMFVDSGSDRVIRLVPFNGASRKSFHGRLITQLLNRNRGSSKPSGSSFKSRQAKPQDRFIPRCKWARQTSRTGELHFLHFFVTSLQMWYINCTVFRNIEDGENTLWNLFTKSWI